ncbi:hypothetical protein [Mycobacteroides saopaulense]|uniref:Uncharacterized protein n=1 Tax=Mycobacteroides saopaulense TaxID=1578165 RepID=A0ABX3BYF3_9MYCO|nr:hypothetical protein [Mycobacteroides saopaulense]OHT86961.1 hypothetical protein BKG68_12855 [Mycobacteroides saopaulense]OHU08817.1 hypothetical protein BKG73_17550 [Mycobacteroides saopaulense]
MWLRLAMASWVTRTLVVSLLLALVLAVLLLGMDFYIGDWHTDVPIWRQLDWWVGIAALSLFLGSLIGITGELDKDKYVQALAGVDPADFRKVSRAVERGPVPEDPVIRQAAARIAEIYRRSERKSRKSSIVRNLILAGLHICAALFALRYEFLQPLFVIVPLVLAIEFIALALRSWRRLPRLEKRVELLTMHESEVPA